MRSKSEAGDHFYCFIASSDSTDVISCFTALDDERQTRCCFFPSQHINDFESIVDRRCELAQQSHRDTLLMRCSFPILFKRQTRLLCFFLFVALFADAEWVFDSRKSSWLSNWMKNEKHDYLFWNWRCQWECCLNKMGRWLNLITWLTLLAHQRTFNIHHQNSIRTENLLVRSKSELF